jgi:hypothetical protein
LQSIFHCEISNDILKLLEIQGNPKIFFDSFLELDRKNMVSMLAFDSKAIKSLLSEKYLGFQDKEYPLIYKNKKQAVRIEGGKKITKNTYYSALDVALDNNQIRAIEIMIKYIIEYQNNYVSYFLFKDNLIELMNRGIELT